MGRKKRPEGTRAPNGASSIYLGKDGKWHGRVTMGVLDDGKPDQRHIERKTETEVIRAVRELESQRDNGKVRKPDRSWTVEKWLRHWLDNIITPSVRYKTTSRYRTDIAEYLIPGLGAHRLDKLQPEHIEKLYAKLRARRPPLASSSIYHVHATLRTSLNEAVRRKHIVENPVLIAKSPQLVEPEIEPLTVEEAQRILTEAATRRNGVRFALALALGLRQGEAIGLKSDDIAIMWRHGCSNEVPCNTGRAMDCPDGYTTGTLTVRRALQRQTWQHGCDNPHECGGRSHRTACPEKCKRHRKSNYCIREEKGHPRPCMDNCKEHARLCPQRSGGGLVEVPTKSRAGRRTVAVPAHLASWLHRHQETQAEERQRAANLWHDDRWLFALPNGKPIDPRVDYEDWRNLLKAAAVRPARLHDARHTTATMLLVLRTPIRAVMDMMGWTAASMASRYMHVPDEIKRGIADQMGGLLWSAPEGREASRPTRSS
jgi:integrase